MELSKQVCSKEQGEKLELLGITAPSIFCHVYPHMNSGWKVLQHGMFDPYDEGLELFPAFTLSELGVMLPEYLKEFQLIQWGIPNKQGANISYGCQYRIEPRQATTQVIPESVLFGDTETIVRAAMLIYLLENNLITASDCNTRLNA